MIPQQKELKKEFLKSKHILICTLCLFVISGCSRLFQKEYCKIQITRRNNHSMNDTMYIKDKNTINDIVNVLKKSKPKDMLKFGSHLHIELFSKEGSEKVYINGRIFKTGTKYYSCTYDLERFIQAQIMKHNAIEAIP